MAEHHIPVILKLDGNFASGMAKAVAAANAMNARLTLMSATWEPHDWSDF